MSGEEPDVETGQRILADSESESSTNESAKDIRSISSEIDIQIEESTEEPSLFDDGYRRTDFVLVYKPSSEKDSGPHENIRQLFEANLEDEGLELEHVHQTRHVAESKTLETSSTENYQRDYKTSSRANGAVVFFRIRCIILVCFQEMEKSLPLKRFIYFVFVIFQSC
ncbi:uncharacterized protein LOC143230788 [Tachypleus tridentatus]|uniref:uncharacterized protein LOC143230788 n=1 Tax=Tachypleus tridentatus TaxID=6853 RepID=UPI003FD51561